MGLNMKRAQFYILGATILCILAYGVLHMLNVPTYKSSAFSRHVQNFLVESPRVINQAVYAGKNVSLALKEFESDYRDYLEGMNEDFALIYAFKEGGRVLVRNLYNATISISSPEGSFNLAKDDSREIVDISWIDIDVDGRIYSFRFSKDKAVETKYLFVQ